MSKPLKSLIRQLYTRRFGDLDGAVLIDISGVNSNDANQMRSVLGEKQVKITVIRNSLATQALEGTAIEGLTSLLSGPNAMVYGGDSVVTMAREVMRFVQEFENLEAKGAIMDGQVFGPDQMEALSKYPTREEAQAQAIQIILSPGQNLIGAVLGPGRKIASLVKAIEEKLEKGETIKK